MEVHKHFLELIGGLNVSIDAFTITYLSDLEKKSPGKAELHEITLFTTKEGLEKIARHFEKSIYTTKLIDIDIRNRLYFGFPEKENKYKQQLTTDRLQIYMDLNSNVGYYLNVYALNT